MTGKVWCDCLSVKIRNCISGILKRYASFACKRPWASLAVSLLFVVVCAPGFALFEFAVAETNHYILGSYSLQAWTKDEEQFSFNPGRTGTFVYFTAKYGKNLFTPEALLEIGRAMDKVLALRIPAGDAVDDFCEKSWRARCEFDSVFHSLKDQGFSMGLNMTKPFDSSMGELEFLAQKLGTLCSEDLDLCRRFLKPQNKFLIVVDNVDGVGPVVVQSLVVIVYLDKDATDSGGSKSYQEYQKVVLEEIHAPTYHMDKDNFQTDNFYTINFSRAAVDLEGSRPATAEGHLMAVAFLVMVIFVCTSIFSPKAPRMRILLSLSCVLVVLVALGCAVALSAYVTVPFTTMTTLCIFTLFGVSVDDIIVIVHYYERTDPNKSIDERIEESLQESGTAITLTSATSLVAFLVAATCQIPFIRYFCVTASFGILSVYILQITLFLPLFVLDERRRAAMRRECCLSICCGVVSEPAANTSVEKKSDLSKNLFQCITAPSVGGGCGLVERYAKLVSYNQWSQIVVILFFFLLTGLGVAGSTQAITEADITDYYVDGSFMKEYFAVNRRLWSSHRPIGLYIEHQGEGMFSDSRRGEIEELFKDLSALEWTFPPESHWLRDFDTWLNLTSSSPLELGATRASLQGNPKAFGAKVAEFLEVTRIALPGTEVPMEPWRHKKDVILEDGEVKHSRLRMQYDSDLKVQAVYTENWKTTYDLFFPNGHGDDFTKGGRVKHVWVFTGMATTAERDSDMKGIIFLNLGIACAAVAVVVMLMLNPLVGLFVGFLVMALDVMVLAMLTAYGVALDFVAFLCLSMSIGLVVDYATHTSHAYLHHQGEPNDKLYNSIREMGSSVLSGGGSTLLGITVLAFASSNGFRNFFYVLGTAVFIGTFVGIIMSPVLLRFLHGTGLFILNSFQQNQEPETESRKEPETESI